MKSGRYGTEKPLAMPNTKTMRVRLNRALGDFVSACAGENEAYGNVSEYIRDLIRRDKERWEREAFDRLKAELTLAFKAPDDSFHPLPASDVITRSGGGGAFTYWPVLPRSAT